MLCGCAASRPSLRAIDTEDAKVIMQTDGRLLVHDELIALDELHTVIEDSSTEPNELIVVQLPHTKDYNERRQWMRAISREMTIAHHYKYSFTTPLMAFVETYDKQTGTTQVFVSGQEVQRLESVEEKEAEVRRLEADDAAYEEGTYVSSATQKPIEEFKGRFNTTEKEPQKATVTKSTSKPTRTTKPAQRRAVRRNR